jgi:hypothetical protein
MGALKWIVVSICGLGGLGVIALGLMSATPARAAARAAPLSPVALRPFPGGPAIPVPAAAAKATPEPLAAAPEKNEKPVDAGTKAAEAPVDAGSKASEAAAKAVVDAGTKAPEAAAKAVVDAGTTPPVAAKAAVPKAEPAPAAAVPDGFIDLQASEAADVFIDGRKVGSAPVNGVKLKAGPHKIRFDCYDAAGNTTPGQAQTVVVPSGDTAEVNFNCPATE